MAGYAWGGVTGRNGQPDKSLCIDAVIVGARFSGIAHWGLSECPPHAKGRSMFLAENVTELRYAIHGQIRSSRFEALPLLLSHINSVTHCNIQRYPWNQVPSPNSHAPSVKQTRWSICGQYFTSS